MPKVQTTRVYAELSDAVEKGYSIISEQGSSRSGKTYNSVLWLCVYALQHPGTTISIVRATLPAIKRSVFRDFKDNMLNLEVWSDRCFNKTEFIYTFPNGSWIEFFSADNEQKLRGSKRQILYVNEANELTFIEWQQLKMRTTMFALLDYNPSFSDDHWLCELNRDPRTYHFISTYKDNPFLEQTIVDEIESLQWKNPTLWQVYGLGLQAVVEGLIFKSVDYVDEIPEKVKKRFLGTDWGFTHDPTAIVEVGISGDELFIDEICYKTEMLTSDIIKELKAYPGYKVISESADPRMVQEIYRAGINIHPVHKYAGSIEAGITRMLEMKIHVTKRSVNAIKEFKNYTYAQDKEGHWLNKPIDTFNHCFTARTKVAVPGGYMNIRDIRPGMSVLTSNGYRKVTRFFENGRHTICDFTLSFGNFEVKIKATPNHRVKTAEGWKQLRELKTGDTLFLQRSLMERLTGYIQGNDISHGAQRRCIGWYGSSIMDLSRRAAIYTIRTGTHGITISPTSNALQAKNTLPDTRKRYGNGDEVRSSSDTLNQSETRQRGGTAAKRASNGISNMASRSSCNQLNERARCVERYSSPEPTTSNSVEATANPSGGVSRDLMTRNGLVPYADRTTSSTSILKSDSAVGIVLESIVVENERKRLVYDIEVEGMHEFFANGVLVHNCMDGIRYVVLEEVLGGVPRRVNKARIAAAVY